MGHNNKKIIESNKEIYSPRWSADGKYVIIFKREVMKLEI